MKNVKFMGIRKVMSLSLDKGKDIPEIKESVVETIEELIGEFDLEENPNKGDVFSLDKNTDIEVKTVKKFLNGDVVAYTNHVVSKEYDEDEKQLVEKYKAIESKKFVEKLRKTNKGFVEFLKLLGSNSLTDEELLLKYKSINEMLKCRDNFLI